MKKTTPQIYPVEFKQQVEELQKEIREVLKDETTSEIFKETLNILLRTDLNKANDYKCYALGYALLGSICAIQMKFDKAENFFQKIQEQHDQKTYNETQYLLGSLYHVQDNIEKAKQYYLNVKKEDNTEVYAKAQFDLGRIFKSENNIENTVKCFLQVEQQYFLEDYDEILQQIITYYISISDKKILLEIENQLNKNLSEQYLKMVTTGLFLIQDNKIKKDLMSILENFISIRNLLQVNKTKSKIYSFENRVAHYAKATTADFLLKNKTAQFRIYSTAKTNDPTEGILLYQYFNYLFKQQKTFWTVEKSSVWASFIGCFTFNHDSLNQFRLYGKEDGQEATGVSMVLKPEFFANTHQNVFALEKQNFNIDFIKNNLNNNNNSLDNKKIGKSLPLYRCIYLDPEKQIKDKNSKSGYKTFLKVAHRDEITFYRENNRGQGRDITEWIKYKKEIENIENQVAENLENIAGKIIEIFNLCEEKNQKIHKEEQIKAKKVIDLILLQLSCFVKHTAFYEEQECRVLKFLPFTDDEIKQDSDRLYIDYASMVNKVEKIYLSPYAKDYADIFRNMGVAKVALSSNPFRNHKN